MSAMTVPSGPGAVVAAAVAAPAVLPADTLRLLLLLRLTGPWAS